MNRTACALAASATLAISLQALAQDKPAPPPAWHQGKPPAMADSKLAPLAGKLTETPASEIPVNKIKLPKGFKAELWATGLPGARDMAFSDSGKKAWVGTRTIGRVYEITDEGDKRTVRVLADKLTQPSGVAFKGGALYVFAIDKVLRFDGIEGNPQATPVDMTKAFNLPPEQHHNWKYVRFGPDGKLYVPFGAPCNICEPPTKEYAQIRRYNPDGSGMEVIATGVRNTQGFDWHPKTGELWFTDHGRDWMGDKGPDDELNRIAKAGDFYGYPFCHAQGIADPDLAKGRKDACKGVTKPVALMGAHAAVMGVKFYTGDMFPKEYQNTMFIARKGSWNRSDRIGFDVVNVRPSADGKSARMTPFMTGFVEDPKTPKFWGRPAYVAQMKDGSLLVSDEQVGAIYRITYQKK
ncbi:MAG TPA: PQQ-dependent sugar dehydrogenase [Burkholderiales bacterium]|jgi:glucose/arabinose dehydrogenase|nr:PQQ-dependent sugar dehydrogenase [Burkholderiales bacterium]